MKKVQTKHDSNEQCNMRPALTPEAREAQMCNLAEALAERQLREGTASSQVITHYLKLGSSQHKKEMERMEEEIKVLKAKVETLKAAQSAGELYSQAIDAFKIYAGRNYDE